MTDNERAGQEAQAWAWYELNAGPRASTRKPTQESAPEPVMAEAA